MASLSGRESRSAPRFESTRAHLARRRRSLLLPILLLVAISILAVGGLLYWTADSLDEREAESQEAMVKSMVRVRRDMLRQVVIGYAWWDEVVETYGVTLGKRWAREGLTEYLRDSFQVTAGWVVSPADEIKLAFESGKDISSEHPPPLPIGADSLAAMARNASSLNDVPAPGFVIYGQELALIAASLVAPVNRVLAPEDYERNVMLLLRPVNFGVLNRTSAGGYLEDLHFTRGPAPAGYTECPIVGVNGQLLGNIVWRETHPGSDLLWSAAPFLLVSLLAVGFLLYLAIRRVETAVSSEGRLSASLYQEQKRRSQKSDFVSMVSHELRTPVHAIGMSSDMLERFGDQMSAAERREEARTIRQAVATLASLVDDVLAMGRTEAVRLDGGSETPVDLARFCQAMWREVSIALRSKQELVLDDQIEKPVRGVKELALHTVLSNLLQNAVKYSRGEGPIKVRLACEGREYSLSVTDFGPGIDEGQRESIFQPYWRSQEVGTISGTGLGLAVARSAAQSMGGDLRLACAGKRAGYDCGTTFVASWSIKE